MKDILKQIQNLKEDFMNLIEVEGLGQPASDVPPSTNKIKKDRKTKNGKVELVSVEDELFPYDGNKREQYRQKIIDTINGMIQGTATLEDLLQIVREKKMPVKESIINELNTSTVKDALNKRIDKSIEADDKEREEFNDILKMKDRDERAKAYKKFEDKSLVRFDKENKKYDLYANYAKKHPELLEALELMEELLLERNKENKVKKNKAVEEIGQEQIDRWDEEGRSLGPYGDDPKKWGRNAMSGVGDNLGVKRSIPKLADKLEYSGIAELDRKLGKKSYFDQEGRNKILNGLYLTALRKSEKKA